MDIQELLKSDDKFKYQLLSRLQSDCNYYLGYGNRNKNKLWAGSEKEQIGAMKKLWESFSTEDKPEWLSWENILQYENRMVSG